MIIRALHAGIGAALAVFMAFATATGGMAQTEKGKELSDRTVRVLMEYAWQILPDKFKAPSGKLIEVDKTKREENMVPVDVAREVIRVGYNSGHAQLCELWEEQLANFNTLMKRETHKKQWTDQQLLYITTLHRMTIHASTGKLRIEEKEGELKVFLEPLVPGKDKIDCSDDRKKRIVSSIQAYLQIDNSTVQSATAPTAPPAMPTGAPALTPAGPTPTSAPAPKK
jgi:hypothetical protein